ncbi:hypothetical protein NDU88_008085 [Pleurodeles waltl]|uniref:Uncharacterized protein n=1 Tax=Pleurodeles waltl TaxID=8319 RepID=A0AAV7N3X6_PLEWA|nr:hypothetical protein NDU88_008085 [Pleurodeles waltl]
MSYSPREDSRATARREDRSQTKKTPPAGSAAQSEDHQPDRGPRGGRHGFPPHHSKCLGPPVTGTQAELYTRNKVQHGPILGNAAQQTC